MDKGAEGLCSERGLHRGHHGGAYRSMAEDVLSFSDDVENERLIKTAKMSYSFENTMYGTLGPERTVRDEEANEAMKETVKKNS